MVDVTKNLPRSSDDLQMDWMDVPFGPFFPGLPGGLMLILTLDGDTVAGSSARALFENMDLPNDSPMACADFVEQLASMDPLAPISYRLLACLAIENAAQIEAATDTARARAGALERERITSHLNWLALFAQQTGFDWLLRRAASLLFRIRQADLQQIMALRPNIEAMNKRLQRTPLLKSRTVGIGLLADDAVMYGPVARASGKRIDARSTDKTFTTLGFTPVYRQEGDAFARLQVRLDEMVHSLALIQAAAAIELPVVADLGQVTGSGEAMVETPRGQACLRLTLDKGRVITAQLDTPSTQHLTLIESLTEQQALGDALLVVGSLDLSPWEMRK
jgi:Ni,Fe-hydrogenase III large subunit